MLDIEDNQLDLFDEADDLTTTQRRVLERTVMLLRKMPLKFVIEEPDGTQHSQGDCELVEVSPRKRSPSKYPRGSVRDHVRSYIGDMEVGDVVSVPVGPYDAGSVQSGIGSYASYFWGKGTVTTARTGGNKYIEVLRIS